MKALTEKIAEHSLNEGFFKNTGIAKSVEISRMCDKVLDIFIKYTDAYLKCQPQSSSSSPLEMRKVIEFCKEKNLDIEVAIFPTNGGKGMPYPIIGFQSDTPGAPEHPWPIYFFTDVDSISDINTFVPHYSMQPFWDDYKGMDREIKDQIQHVATYDPKRKNIYYDPSPISIAVRSNDRVWRVAEFKVESGKVSYSTKIVNKLS